MEWRVIRSVSQYSNIDGFLSDKKNFSLENLSLGTHKITFIAIDANGNKVEDNVSISVEKSELIVSIISPEDQRVYDIDKNIPVDYKIFGGEKPYNLQWYIDGIPAGEIKELPLLSKGKHEISLLVTDSIGNSVKKSVKIILDRNCNFDGTCDVGENFLNCREDCPSGSKDNYCDSVKDDICDIDCERSLDEDCLCNNNGICEINFENFLNCKKDCPSGSKDNYCDKVEDKICDPDCSNKEDIDCREDYSNYLILFFLVIAIILASIKIRKILKP